MKKFYYIGLKEGKTNEGIVRAESIDAARRKLTQEGVEEVNLAILRSDNVDFLDLDRAAEESVNH